MIAALSLALGVVAGYLAGGKIRGLAGIHLKYEVPLLIGFGVQGLARGRLIGVQPTSWGVGVWVVVSLVLVVLLLSDTLAWC
jgi:hypothetical protein